MASTYVNKQYPSSILVKAGHGELPPAPDNPKTYVYNIRGTNGRNGRGTEATQAAFA